MSREQSPQPPAGDGPATDEYLRAVTIGESKPHNDTVTLVPYDPQWPQQYARLAARIRNALGAGALVLEHVGSTSVPGLSAKPVIDIVLAVADSADEPAYVPPLAAQGFVLRTREPDWFEHRMIRTPEVDGNLHVFSEGCAEIGRMVAFRDRLRADAQDRLLYERTKQELAARTWRHVQHYADAKAAVVREILGRADLATPPP
jgi:GrpB-like predicted nucleotidyltransferase (UPF0157 family)